MRTRWVQSCIRGRCWQSRRDDDGFPTPTSLFAAQRQYANKHKKAQRKNDGEVPEPFPPPTLKAEIYNVADYSAVDAHAGKVWLLQFSSSVSALRTNSTIANGSLVLAKGPWFSAQGRNYRVKLGDKSVI